MSKRLIYKIVFVNQEKVYEIYAKHINQSSLFGFVEVEELLFGEKSNLVIDPEEERLKNEFSGVKQTYIPMHSVIRIDAVEKKGVSKITSIKNKANNISHLPNSSIYSQMHEDKKDHD